MPSISLCMLTFNEEKFLRECINSVKNIVDEIIILDSGSTDRTIAIAKKFNAKIYYHKWPHDFSKARNKCLKYAAKDWILILDADETISKKDVLKIKPMLKRYGKGCIGFMFIQRTYAHKEFPFKWNWSKEDNYKESRKYLGWNYRGLTRLFKNDKRIKFQYPMHETVLESIKKLKGSVMNTLIPIHHFEIERNAREFKRKREYYLKLLRKKIAKYPKAKFYAEYGIELLKAGRVKEAKNIFQKSVKMNSHYKLYLNFLEKHFA